MTGSDSHSVSLDSLALPDPLYRLDPQEMHAWTRVEASWRRMLVTQPAIRGTFQTANHLLRWPYGRYHYENFANSNAVTMGAMILEFEGQSVKYLLADMSGRASDWECDYSAHLVCAWRQEMLERNEQLEEMITYARRKGQGGKWAGEQDDGDDENESIEDWRDMVFHQWS